MTHKQRGVSVTRFALRAWKTVPLKFAVLYLLAAWACSSPPASERSEVEPTEIEPAATGSGGTVNESGAAGVAEGPTPTTSGNSAREFVDATASSGIDFIHFNGTTGEFLLPEITGSGGALFDYDNDGRSGLVLGAGSEAQVWRCAAGVWLAGRRDASRPALSE